MASVKISVKAEVLKWAIRESDADYEELLEVFPKLDLWLEEKEQPTFAKLEALSKKMHLPLGYLLLDYPPKENIELLDYRTVDSQKLKTPSRNLIDTIYEMKEKQDWMHDYLLREGYDPLKFVGEVKGTEEVQTVARKIREGIGLKSDWYRYNRNAADAFKMLRELLENCGILIMVNGIVGSNTKRNLDVAEFRAFTMIDDYAPLIFINGKDSNAGRLFSLCHEAAHIFYGENSLYNDNFRMNETFHNRLEKNCNAVAAELLVPCKDFIEQWEGRSQLKTEDKIKVVARYFNVSRLVIARRALENGKIDREFYEKEAKACLEIVQKRTASGGNYYNNAKYKIDRRFFNAVNRSAKNGRLLYTDAYRLTGLSRKSYEKFELLKKGER